ncbi:MAG: hypothetical protein R3208_02325 [Ketobacteraceae bacterium]|nr:hypothetical protein [Ketobacteraceae bacterium]
MAILWQQQEDGTHYEVRQAGRSVRLYSNGVLHSQYNPDRPVTRSVWDLLTLPALFLPQDHIQRVLLLGVGGGAVLHQLNRWFNPGLMIGVELSGVHLHVAKHYFQLNNANTVLYEADARDWLSQYQGPPFDMIIDDLYGHHEGEPVRAVPLDRNWCELLDRHVAHDGLLVVNTVAWKELKQSSLVADADLQQRFASAFRLVTPTCDNAVGAFFRRPAKKRFFRERMAALEELNQADRSGLLRYQIRKLL